MRRSTVSVLQMVTVSFSLSVMTAAGQPVKAQTASPPQELPGQVDILEVQIPTREDADRVVTLSDAIDIALDRSFDIYRLTERYLQISYGLEEAQRRLRTRVDLISTIPSISQEYSAKWIPGEYKEEGESPLVFVHEGVSYLYTALKIEQPLPTNGQLTLGSRILGYDHTVDPMDDYPDQVRSIQPRLWVGFNQPLFQFNEVKGQLLEARLKLESLEKSYTEAELTRMNEITRKFYELFGSQQALEIAYETFQQSEINYQIAHTKYVTGIASQLDELSFEVAKINNYDRLESARSRFERLQRDFSRLVGLPLDTRVWAESDQTFIPVDVDLERALQHAINNRSDIRQAQIDLEISDLKLQRITSLGRPDIQLDLQYDVTGNSARCSEIDAGNPWSDHLSKAFKGDYWSPSTNVSITMRVPIFDWRLNDSSVNRQLSLMRVQERKLDEVVANLRRDVENIVNSVESAKRRMEVLGKNRTLAQTTFQISQERFRKGEISSTELLIAQQQYMDTEILFTNSYIDYEIAKADLREITLWNWEANRPIPRRTTPLVPFAEGQMLP